MSANDFLPTAAFRELEWKVLFFQSSFHLTSTPFPFPSFSFKILFNFYLYLGKILYIRKIVFSN